MTEITRMVVSQDDLIEIGKHLRLIGTYYLSGSYSISIPGKIKYLNEKVVRKWPDLDGEIIDMVPGEAARVEMARAWPDLKRVGWSGPAVKLFRKRPPMYYIGPADGHMTLVDLTSAYWQIYRLLWLDVSYPCGYYGKFPLYEVAERLKDWKPARNAVVGISRSMTTTGVKGDKKYTLRTTNKYLSPGLWATVQDTLNWIAYRAVQFGAIYVNTDGYIFPHETGGSADFTEWLGSTGFSCDIRARGFGQIVSWNNYKVGGKSTKPYRLGLIHNTRSFSNVERPRFAQWGKYYSRVRNIVRYELSERTTTKDDGQEAGIPEANGGDGGLDKGDGRIEVLRSGPTEGRKDAYQSRLPGLSESNEAGGRD